MAETRPTSIFIPMFEDFSPERRDETNRWFDTDHVPQRLSCPGFLRAERYELADLSAFGPTPGKLRYLNFYYIAGPEVIESEEYKRQVGQGTARGKRSPMARTGVMLRDVWVKRPSPWESRYFVEPEGPKTLHIIMLDIAAGHDDEYNEHEDDEHVPQRLSCPGFLRCERFERADVAIPGPACPPSPKYMNVYHIASPETVTAEAYVKQQEFNQRQGWQASPAKPQLRFRGVYRQRSSPWVVRPAAQ